MKSKFSVVSLKALIITAVLIGICFGLVILYRIQTPVTLLMFLGMGAPALVIAFQLYKLVSNSQGTAIISRENLMRVRRIQHVLLLMLLIKAMVAVLSSLHFIGFLTILLLPFGILCSSWELLVGILIIYVLANVFERAIILKEEEALTI